MEHKWLPLKHNFGSEMKKIISYLLFGAAMTSTLVACTTTPTPTPTNTNQTACRETGLTNAGDSKLGQLECGPVTSRATDSAK